jgi:serine/threonine protein kinase
LKNTLSDVAFVPVCGDTGVIMTIIPPPYVLKIDNPSRRASYYCVSCIGEGGFGSVWRAVTNAGIHVAVKVWKPTSNPARDFIDWYNEQALYLQCLLHPNIVTTYDQFVSPEGWLVIVMELAQGSLIDLVRAEGAPSPRAVVAIGAQLCMALEYIHGLGVIHRDVTPRNVLWYGNGIFKISDFGISKQAASGEGWARTMIGFPNAIPPELLSLGYSSVQSDIYQLGLVLLYLLTGRDPIPLQADRNAVHAMILQGVPRRIAEELTSTYGALAGVISVMLRRRDAWRYRSATDVRIALDTAVQGLR